MRPPLYSLYRERIVILRNHHHHHPDHHPKHHHHRHHHLVPKAPTYPQLPHSHEPNQIAAKAGQSENHNAINKCIKKQASKSRQHLPNLVCLSTPVWVEEDTPSSVKSVWTSTDTKDDEEHVTLGRSGGKSFLIQRESWRRTYKTHIDNRNKSAFMWTA